MSAEHRESGRFRPPLPQTPPKDESQRRRPGEDVLVATGLAIGILLLGVQLWLLTLAFDLYLSGERGATLLAAVFSGLVFLGGILMWRLLDRPRPRT